MYTRTHKCMHAHFVAPIPMLGIFKSRYCSLPRGCYWCTNRTGNIQYMLVVFFKKRQTTPLHGIRPRKQLSKLRRTLNWDELISMTNLQSIFRPLHRNCSIHFGKNAYPSTVEVAILVSTFRESWRNEFKISPAIVIKMFHSYVLLVTQTHNNIIIFFFSLYRGRMDAMVPHFYSRRRHRALTHKWAYTPHRFYHPNTIAFYFSVLLYSLSFSILFNIHVLSSLNRLPARTRTYRHTWSDGSQGFCIICRTMQKKKQCWALWHGVPVRALHTDAVAHIRTHKHTHMRCREINRAGRAERGNMKAIHKERIK